MQVTIDHLEGLERRIKVVLPADRLEQKVHAQLQRMASQVKLKGFRQKKVPFSEVQKRFRASVYHEVAIEEMKASLKNILVEKNIAPVVVPNIQVDAIEMGQPLTYFAEFEEYPAVDLMDFTSLQVEKLTTGIPEEQVDKFVEDLRRQNAQLKDVARPAAKGDTVVLDFKGTIEGKEFAGGSAKAVRVELGKGMMLPDFEKQLIGVTAGQNLSITLVFPENYHKDISGKQAIFDTVILNVLEAELPTYEKLLEKLGFQEESKTAPNLSPSGMTTPSGEGEELLESKKSGMEALRAQIKKSIESQVSNILKQKTKLNVINKLTELHDMPLPKALITQELQRLKNQAAGEHHHEHDEHCDHDHDALESNQPADQQTAERNVKQALLLREIMKVNKLTVDAKRVREQLLTLVRPGQDPKQVLAWFYEDKRRYSNVEAAVLEEQIVEKVLEQAQITEKLVSYEEAIK